MTDEPPKPPDEPPKPPEQSQASAPETGHAAGVRIPISPQLQAAILAQLQAAQFQYPPAPGPLSALPVQIQQALQIWQSPYPPPEAAERYENLCPGTFGRILGMVERLQAAQIDQNKSALQSAQKDTRRGQWLGFSLGLAALAGAFGSLLLAYPWVAGAFLSLPVMTVAKALIDSARAPTMPQPLVTQPVTPPPPGQKQDR